MPRQILLPLVVAVNKLAELRSEGPFNWSAVDFVTDRNALRKLARWAKCTIKKNTSFRFDLHLAGESTILMNRGSHKDGGDVGRKVLPRQLRESLYHNHSWLRGQYPSAFSSCDLCESILRNCFVRFLSLILLVNRT